VDVQPAVVHHGGRIRGVVGLHDWIVCKGRGWKHYQKAEREHRAGNLALKQGNRHVLQWPGRPNSLFRHSRVTSSDEPSRFQQVNDCVPHVHNCVNSFAHASVSRSLCYRLGE